MAVQALSSFGLGEGRLAASCREAIAPGSCERLSAHRGTVADSLGKTAVDRFVTIEPLTRHRARYQEFNVGESSPSCRLGAKQDDPAEAAELGTWRDSGSSIWLSSRVGSTGLMCGPKRVRQRIPPNG